MHFLNRTFGAAILRAPDDAAASGATTIDGATAAILALSAPPEPAAEPEQPEQPEPESAETGEPETDTQPEPESQPAEDLDAAETPSEEEPADKVEPDLPAIEPPHFWDAKDKAAFAEAPRHVQEKIVAYEAQRNTAASKAIQQAREAESQAQAAKLAADQEASAIADMKAKVDKLVPDAEAQFRATWGDNPDWVALHTACLQQYPDNPQQALAQFQAYQAQHAVEFQQLQGLRAAKQEVEAQATKARDEAAKREQDARRAFATAEAEKLKALAPELADPKHGPTRVNALIQFARGLGYDDARLADAGATDLAVLHDAMKFRQAQAAAKTAPTQPKTPVPQARPTVKPTAAPAAIPTAARNAQESKNRFAQKPSIDNAVAAILARSGQKG